MADINDRLQQRAQLNRMLRDDRAFDRRMSREAQQEFRAEVLSYDRATGRYRCRLPDGSEVLAKSISTGAIALRSVVDLYLTSNGAVISGLGR